MLSRDSEDKMGCDLCLNLWYDLKRLLWQDELNPRVRCAFGNVLLLLLLKSKVKRLQPFQIDIKPSEVPGGAYSYWLSLSIKALFLSMYVVAWQSIVFDEMWNIRNSLLFPPQKDDNWQGQGKGAEAVRKFWRFTRQSCTTSRYRCIVW